MTHSNLAQNLSTLRRLANLSQEKAAEAVGVSRQALAKWESGETTPDILHCDALAQLYNVSLDSLLHFQHKDLPPPPKGRHVFGTAQLGDRGQLVIPKRARDCFGLRQGDSLVVLGDTNPSTAGIALIPARFITSLLDLANQIQRDADQEVDP